MSTCTECGMLNGVHAPGCPFAHNIFYNNKIIDMVATGFWVGPYNAPFQTNDLNLFAPAHPLDIFKPNFRFYLFIYRYGHNVGVIVDLHNGIILPNAYVEIELSVVRTYHKINTNIDITTLIKELLEDPDPYFASGAVIDSNIVSILPTSKISENLQDAFGSRFGLR